MRKVLRKEIIFLSIALLLSGSSPLLGLELGQTPMEEHAPINLRGYILSDGSTASSMLGTDSKNLELVRLGGWPNATRYYEDVIRIKNHHNLHHTIELSFVSWSGATSSVKDVRVRVFDGSDTQQGNTIEVGRVDSSTGGMSIPPEAEWRVQWEVLWNAGASDKDAVEVTLMLQVLRE